VSRPKGQLHGVSKRSEVTTLERELVSPRLIPLLPFTFRRGGFARDVATLMCGTGVAQGLAIVAAPILTRLYNPIDFGVFAVFATVLSVSGPLISARYELAIVPSEDDDVAFGLLILSCFIALAMGLLVVALFAFNRLASSLGLQVLVPYRWIVFVSIVLCGFYEALRQFRIREQQYRRISISQVVQSGASVTVQTAGRGFLGLGGVGLLLGQVAGIGFSTYSLGRGIGKCWSSWRTKHRGQILNTLQNVAIRHYKHPAYLPWGGFLDGLAQRLPILMLSAFYGPYFLGLYAIADRLLRTPIYLLGQASSQVLFRKMTEQNVKAQMPRLLIMWAILGTVASFLPLTLLGIFSRSLFSFALGRAWESAGSLAVLLIPLYWGALVVSPVSGLLIIANRQGMLLVIQILFLLSGFSALWFGHRFLLDGPSTLLLYSMTQWCVYGLYFLALLFAARSVARDVHLVKQCAA
jgi:lipopolysaccharide exporter